MSTLYFTSDLHLGHKAIGKYRDNIGSMEENTEWIREQWINTVKRKDDIVFVLGDAAFSDEGLDALRDLKGRKILIRGNHDTLKTQDYLGVFEHVYGLHTRKRMWMSHGPLHPLELRGKVNLHGHVHYQDIPDPRYLNVCCDALWRDYRRAMINLDTVRAIVASRTPAIEALDAPKHEHEREGC